MSNLSRLKTIIDWVRDLSVISGFVVLMFTFLPQVRNPWIEFSKYQDREKLYAIYKEQGDQAFKEGQNKIALDRYYAAKRRKDTLEIEERISKVMFSEILKQTPDAPEYYEGFYYELKPSLNLGKDPNSYSDRDLEKIFSYSVPCTKLHKYEEAMTWLDKLTGRTRLSKENLARILAAKAIIYFHQGDSLGTRLRENYGVEFLSKKHSEIEGVKTVMRYFKKSVDLFKQSLRIHRNPEVYYNLGVVYLSRGELSEAEQIFRELLDRGKFTNSKVYYHYAQTLYWKVQDLFQAKQLEEGEQLIEKVINLLTKASILDLHDWMNYHFLARCYAILDQYELSNQCYEIAAQKGPNIPKIFNDWAVVLMNMEHYKEAIGKCEKATKLDPNYALAYINWGECLLATGKKENNLRKYKEAIEKFRRAALITPNNPEIYILWKEVLQALGLKEEARKKSYIYEKLQSGVSLNVDEIFF